MLIKIKIDNMFTTPTAGAMFGGMMPGMTAQQIAKQQQLVILILLHSKQQQEFMEQNNKEVYFKNLNH